MINKENWRKFCSEQKMLADFCKRTAKLEINILESKASIEFTNADKKSILLMHNALRNNNILVGTDTLLADLNELIAL